LTEVQTSASVQKYQQLLFWLVKTSFFPTKNYFCSKRLATTRYISSETVLKCIQNHGLRHHFKKGQATPTFHRSGCQNQPRLLNRVCFGDSSVRISQKLALRSSFYFPARFRAQKWLENNLTNFFLPSDCPVFSPVLNLLDCFA
jgi:hypothetical protein